MLQLQRQLQLLGWAAAAAVFNLLRALCLQLHAVQMPVTAPLVWHIEQQPLGCCISAAVALMTIMLLLQLLPMVVMVVVGVSAVLDQQGHTSVQAVHGRKHPGNSMSRPRLQLQLLNKHLLLLLLLWPAAVTAAGWLQWHRPQLLLTTR